MARPRRALTMAYAILPRAAAYSRFVRPWIAVCCYTVLVVWTLATLPRVRNAPSYTKRFLAADPGIALTGILLTALADNHERIAAGGPTLRRTVVGDPVFTPGLAGLVLGEYRRLAAEPAPPPAPASRTHPG